MGAFAATLNGKVVLFGGYYTGAPSGVRGDMWTFDGTTWSQVTPTSAPDPRAYGSAATLGSKVVLFGGYGKSSSGYKVFGDTWTWDGTSWSQVSTSGPSARIDAAMAGP
jgi:hypothetical protein